MKLPIIRQIQRTCSAAEIESAIKVLESASESTSLKGEDIDVIGELISNMCGALEVHDMVLNGMAERDAVNAFMKKVLSSIDQ